MVTLIDFPRQIPQIPNSLLLFGWVFASAFRFRDKRAQTGRFALQFWQQRRMMHSRAAYVARDTASCCKLAWFLNSRSFSMKKSLILALASAGLLAFGAAQAQDAASGAPAAAPAAAPEASAPAKAKTHKAKHHRKHAKKAAASAADDAPAQQ
jgi:hypothetical protein